MRRAAAIIAGLTIAFAHLDVPARAEAPPFPARRRGALMPSERATALVEPSDWPEEPASPHSVDEARFATALRTLCGGMPPGRAERYSTWTLQNARAANVDPFLIGALVFRMGHCDPHAHELEGTGLTLVPERMYWDSLRGGIYRYQVREHGRWQQRERRMDRFGFAGPSLERAEANLYFTAQLLAAWQEQHASVDAAFEQSPHRSVVSHWIWGDRVRSARAEDRVLTDRRRLLFYYGAAHAMPARTILGVTMGAPLDGAPRVVSGWIGADREGGARAHRGTDVEASLGEPVRAIADGRVTFSGVDFPGGRASEQMTRAQIDATPRGALGPGGRYVCITHREGDARLTSCAMHLEQVLVSYGERVTRGQQIGTVGRTGMQESAAHLHLELHGPSGLLDASEHLRGFLIGRKPPEETSRAHR